MQTFILHSYPSHISNLPDKAIISMFCSIKFQLYIIILYVFGGNILRKEEIMSYKQLLYKRIHGETEQ